MKTLCLLLLLAALTVNGQTTNPPPHCCRFPLRAVGQGSVVDLTPLVQWWQNQDGQAPGPRDFLGPQRPLTAWKRVVGFKTSELDAGWLVQADIYTNLTTHTNEWILLKHPPAAEEQQYYYLQSLAGQYEQRIKTDERTAAAETRAAQRDEQLQNKVEHAFSKLERTDAFRYQQRAQEHQQAAAAARKDQQETSAALEQIRKKLPTFPNVRGQYQLDCFALELGRNRKGMAVYDAGAVDWSAP